MSIWDFEISTARWLIAWCALSVWGGFALLFTRNTIIVGIGVEGIIWGSFFALVAILVRRRAQAWSACGDSDTARVREASLASNVLWVGIIIYIVLVVVGLVLALIKGNTDVVSRAHGWGLVVQMVVMFVFNLACTQMIPRR